MSAEVRQQARDRQLAASRQHSVAKILRIEIQADVDETVDQEHPDEGEVIVASPSPVAERAGLVPGEAPVLEPERGRIALIAGVAPIQLGEVEEDVDSAPDQIGAGDQVDPVTDADADRVDASRHESAACER